LVYFLDHTNGKPLIGIEERPVLKGPRQKDGKNATVSDRRCDCTAMRRAAGGYERAGCIFEVFWKEPTLIQPSGVGGINWSPTSYNPDTGSFYVPGTVRTSAFARYGDTYKKGKQYNRGAGSADRLGDERDMDRDRSQYHQDCLAKNLCRTASAPAAVRPRRPVAYSFTVTPAERSRPAMHP
jgi:hypothetical protein